MNTFSPAFRLAAVALLITGSLGCEYDGGFLFADPIPGVPGVLDLKGEGGGPINPVDITSPAEAREATVYAEVGPHAGSGPSGATFEFVGNGQDVCVFIDPELVFWNQSVSQQAPERRFRFPDNPYDDGDIDMQVGLSVYYRGTPGETMGGFEVQYTDDLGNDVEILLVSCQNTGSREENNNAHSGRGAPEYCTVRNTQPGVAYTVALEAFALPRDDARLSFGVIVSNGPCDGDINSLISVAAPSTGQDTLPVNEECIIQGEALPGEDDGKIFFGYEAGRSIEGSEEFEEAYCQPEGLNIWCRQELNRMEAAGLTCDYTGVSDDPARRCFCGDLDEVPNPGAGR